MKKVDVQEEVLFEAARNLTDPTARRAFLDQACRNDPEMRERLESLLAATGEADEFFGAAAQFEIPAGDVPGDKASAEDFGLDDELVRTLGSRVGRYKLLQKIGEGGCGVVYMADQEEPVRRRVALKIIKLGMDTRNVIARFEAERQALAMMDHPNIARVLDAGATETGRPFFVMELVRGHKITEYCDQNQLDTQGRLSLFIQVCHAIQHAHQKGIIHRDIKPSNILVTLHDGAPVPKVIDFGIAKATETRLTDKTLFTAYEQIIGTPAYMSPEQAEMSGLDVDTRSDIYSLGVLLYELLTGKTPFDAKELMKSGLDEMRRTLRETEPYRPSMRLNSLRDTELTTTALHRHVEPPKLISELRGDLDWIVMKALEKDRRLRYETVNGLAMDVQRHLNEEPVLARPYSRWYRFQKLVSRNRAVFAGVGAVAAALILLLGVITLLLVRTRAAEREQIQLRLLADHARDNEAKLRREAETREKINRASVLVSQEKYDEAEKLAYGITFPAPTVEGSVVMRSLGEWRAMQGQWKAAADHFGVLLRIDQLDGLDVCTLDYLEYGPALIEDGDTEGYGRFRRAAIASFGGATNLFADRILKISLLLPADAETLSSLSDSAQVMARTFAPSPKDDRDVFLAAWRSIPLALYEYRSGDCSKAADWCGRCLAYPEPNAPREATARVILAMASWKSHQPERAVSELALSRKLIEARFNSGLERGNGMLGFWFDWVFARVLLREATAMIEATSK